MPKSAVKPVIKPENKGLKLLLHIRKNPLRYFHGLGLKEGGYAWLKLGTHRVLFLNDAHAIDQVFKGEARVYHKGIYNEGIRPLMGHSVFMSEEDLWKKQRRMAAPAFSGGRFELYVEQINAAVDAMIDRWDHRENQDESIDISKEMMLLTLDVVFRTMFNQDDCKTQQEISQGLYTLLNMAEQRIWRPLNVPMSVELLLPKYQQAMSFLNRVSLELANARTNNAEYPSDLLTIFLEGHGSTKREKKLLRDNILSFLLAGHETTANAMSWAFLELGRNSDARSKLIQEVDAQGPNNLNLKAARCMSYALAVLDEAMRLYPPIWSISRESKFDQILKLETGQELFVPADTTLMLCAYTVHRRERYWKDPESFYPDRFLIEDWERPKSAWFPFGGGARLCMGFRLAEMEASCIFHKFFQRYDMALVPNQNIAPRPAISLRPDQPIWIKLKKRSKDEVLVESSHHREPIDEADICPFKHGAAHSLSV